MSWHDYPYVDEKQPCAYNASKVVTKINGIGVLHNEYYMRDEVGLRGPVSICKYYILFMYINLNHFYLAVLPGSQILACIVFIIFLENCLCSS